MDAGEGRRAAGGAPLHRMPTLRGDDSSEGVLVNQPSRTQKTVRKVTTELIDACEFLLGFVPEWAADPSKVEPGYGEMFYGTLSYEGDVRVARHVEAIRKLVANWKSIYD